MSKRKWLSYMNGNVQVSIDPATGTRVEETKGTEPFRFDFPTSIDLNVSSLCRYNCPYCYAGNGPEGKDADLSKYDTFFSSLHPYTEAAVNGNNASSRVVYDVLHRLKEQQVIGNLTVNAADFMEHSMLLDANMREGLIHGLGISLGSPSVSFPEVYKKVKRDITCAPDNVVYHVINGIWDRKTFDEMCCKGVKVLVLGYKDVGRGKPYEEHMNAAIQQNMQQLADHLGDLLTGFRTVGFDNLACEQLRLKEFLEKHPEYGVEWDSFYSGDDGTQSMYVDLVRGTYAINSMSDTAYPMADKSIDEMFAGIKR